jgi:endonuclease-3 related protein
MARRDVKSATLRRIYDLLFEAFGPQHWWPARTRDEMVIGAVLAQNTAWTNVERAIGSLRQANRLTLDRIHQTPVGRLAELVRPAGTYRVKAERLKCLAGWLHTRFGGDLGAVFALGVEAARRELLAVKGIGPETADAILLYAGRLPVFVVDAYTQRILRRHLLIPADGAYEQTRALLERALPWDEGLFGEYHALLVELGKRYCRARARCEGCPLAVLGHEATL